MFLGHKGIFIKEEEIEDHGACGAMVPSSIFLSFFLGFGLFSPSTFPFFTSLFWARLQFFGANLGPWAETLKSHPKTRNPKP